MRRIWIFIGLLVVLAAIIAGYEFIANFSYTRHITLPASLLASSSTDVNGSSTDNVNDDVGSSSASDSSSASSTAEGGVWSSIDPSLMSPTASSTVDISSWLTYSDGSDDYSIRYPSNISVNMDDSGGLVLAFPKDQYFHWPLLDDAKVTITVGTSCPSVVSGATSPAPTTISLNGYTFTRTEGGDIGAGNIYRELAYDMEKKGRCYHIDLLDHGTDGAGFYVEDQSLISSYDAAHSVDLSAVLGIFNDMIGTFRLTGSML
jgi:hypothetical protein